ncbi:MAG: hypothetical protein K940chlam3_01346, partial [Chlamydiae bacterium]|nr:hypothetical protein [Chlamydiota bacterium]
MRLTFLLILFITLTHSLFSGEKPRCFICYAWGTEQHEQWVKRFAQDLEKAGFSVLLDHWESGYGDQIVSHS